MIEVGLGCYDDRDKDADDDNGKDGDSGIVTETGKEREELQRLSNAHNFSGSQMMIIVMVLFDPMLIIIDIFFFNGQGVFKVPEGCGK